MAAIPKTTSVFGTSHRWEGHSHTLHRKYLLPISSNLEQGEYECSVGRKGHSRTPTLMPHESDVLSVDCTTESWLESVPNSLSEQWKAFDQGSTGLTSTDPTYERLWANNDIPLPLMQSSRMMRNQPPWKYQNFTVWHNDILPGAFIIWVGLCICLHIISWMHIILLGNTMWRHSVLTTTDLPNSNDSWHHWGYHPCQLYGGFGGGRPKDIWSKHSCPTAETKKG